MKSELGAPAGAAQIAAGEGAAPAKPAPEGDQAPAEGGQS
jgi:hypothetical protein